MLIVRNSLFINTHGLLLKIAGGSLGLILAGCVSVNPFVGMRLKISKTEPFVIQQTDASTTWGHLSHPVLYELSEDYLLLGYNRGGDGVSLLEAEARIPGPAISHDGGKTWSIGNVALMKSLQEQLEQKGWLNRETESALVQCRLRGFTRLPDDTVFFMIDNLRPHSEGKAWAKICRIKDDMINVSQSFFSVPTNFVTLGSRTMSVSWKGACSTNGALYVVGYHGRRGEKFSSSVFVSFDQGDTFSYLSTIAKGEDTPWGINGPCEPALVELRNGELFSLMRTGSQKNPEDLGASSPLMLQARSMDQGKSWKIKRSLFPGVRPKLLEMSNGVLVCAFGRPGNNIIFSLDDGQSWGAEQALSALDTKTSGYCDIAEVAPGRLLVVYDALATTTERIWLWDPPEPVNALWGVFVDVQKR